MTAARARVSSAALDWEEVIDQVSRGSGKIHKVALLGNHMPRQCGIATFTTDLSNAIATEFPELDCFVLAMNDVGKRYGYPSRVRFEIDESEPRSYLRAADFLNVNDVDVVSLQHEYGIFGGKAGGHVMTLLRELRPPIVTTLHTILAEPSPVQRAVMDELTDVSSRLVVMSAEGAKLLREVHGVPEGKIDLIPHGIPGLPFVHQSKEKLGVEDKQVLLTFGLLSPDKGIEYVIDALPGILESHPDVVYIVLGATHPHVKERHGETYRFMLESRAQKLGVASNIIFYNRFVSHEELVEFLAAADVYITPYLNAEQITSGTLAYALGAGKAVISTPYRYARELLADGRGCLVPWRDAQAIAKEVNGLLGDDDARQIMEERAAAYGRGMTWPVVAHSYMRAFTRARLDQKGRLRRSFQAKTLAKRPAELPELNLAHLHMMTDDTGVLQHASFTVPRYEDGYCVDDNARALLLITLIEDAGAEVTSIVRALASRYLAFLKYSFNESNGRFRNFMTYSRQWTEQCGSEDSHGRALWALGSLVGRSSDPGRQRLGRFLLESALPVVTSFTSPRAWAYALLGIDEYLHAFEGDSRVQSIRNTLAERLLELYERTSRRDWPWFEDSLTYCNARLSQALIVSGPRMGNERMTAVGLGSLQWLVSVQASWDGYFSPIGSDGFYPRGKRKALFDQQPVEACAMISACLEAHRATGREQWAGHARHQFAWFLGENPLQQPLYDSATGGCRDGLHPDRANENQGAESTLSFLLALLEMRAIDRIDAAPSVRALHQTTTEMPMTMGANS